MDPHDLKIEIFAGIIDAGLPEDIIVNGEPYKLEHGGKRGYILTRKIHKKINFKWLVDNEFINITNSDI